MKALEYLEADNPAVLSLGLNPVAMKNIGAGYASRGVAKGSVLLPIRDQEGTLLGYFGCQDLTYIPPDFQLGENVTLLKKA